jgi:amino-acid N-acetyltransferase
MKNELSFSFAGSSDFDRVIDLLQHCDLPFTDLEHRKMNEFILASDNGRVAGCIGMEIYGDEGLLRSLAVRSELRKKGIGSQLVDRLIAFAVQRGVKKLHLLTNTAEIFFSAKGFKRNQRTEAPSAISQSAEFSYICPSSAVYMVLDNLSGRSVFYEGGLQVKLIEQETQSRFWEIAGQKMRFTYFEVPPHALFGKHSHESEQITYVLEGELFFSSAGNTWCLKPGDLIVIPSNIEHKVWTEEKAAKAVDAWSKF